MTSRHHQKINNHKTAPGGIAIYLIVSLSILFLTTTIAATRLTVSEQNQSAEASVSNQAFYAAEAGVEEATRRLVRYPDRPIEEIFPEQFIATNQVGDRARVADENGDIPMLTVSREIGSFDPGVAAWRNRTVVDSYTIPIGTQVKDEVIQLDVSNLFVDRGGTVYCDTLPQSGCDEEISVLGYSSVREMHRGTEYCWQKTPSDEPLDIEFTILSWDAGNPQDVTTSKLKVDDRGGAISTVGTIDFGNGSSEGSVTVAGASGSDYDHCAEIRMDSTNRPHLIRIKPIFPDVGNGTTAEQNQFSVEYRTGFLNAPFPTLPTDDIYIPDNAVLIDVTGVSGTTERRLVVKRERAGRILGIFDFAIYSGDTEAPLCKGGVVQEDYNYRGCVVTGL